MTNLHAYALTAIVAAIDGYNPYLSKDENGKGILLPHDESKGFSDIDLAILDLLYREDSKTGAFEDRCDPAIGARQIAWASLHLVGATAQVLGHNPDDVDKTAVADILRMFLQKMALDENGQG